jgi:DNA-binding response OmpR family regulator
MRLNVLVAEDDAITRRGLIELLEQEGYGCTGAPNGLSAWELFQARRPDFVCLDVMMPGESGYDVCKRIRSIDESVPVVFITAKGEEIDKVVGLELGADDYIVKPFGVKEVLARIRAVTRRCLHNNERREAEDFTEPFEMEHVRIIPSELRAIVDSEVVDLSLRELKLLVYLYRRRGQVIPRQELMTAIWNQDYFPSSRTLDQTISQLRKRIEANPKSPRIIQTVHGVGYRYP